MKDPLMMPSDEVPGPVRPVGVGDLAGANNPAPASTNRTSAVVEVGGE